MTTLLDTATRVWVVDREALDASDANPGTDDRPFLTIQAAADCAMPGDTVRVHAGVYRERVCPARGGEPERPITYEAAEGESVILRGSEEWQNGWDAVPDRPGVYEGRFPSGLFGDFNPYRRSLNAATGRKTLGQVFVNGTPLLECDTAERVDALCCSWMALPGGKGLRVHLPDERRRPEDLHIEFTVRNRIFAPLIRGLGHVVVRGFVMEHCANDFPRGFWHSDTPQAGALGCRGGHHWVIERNVVRFAKTVGIDCGSEGEKDADGRDQPEPEDSGYHLIRGNDVSDNGAAGLIGYRTPGTRIVRNVFERNNCLGFTAPETAAIKLHFFVGGLVEDNLIRDNDTCGIWLDNVWHDSRVCRNLIVANQGAGLFLEMGWGPLTVDHNVVAFTRATTSLGGDGVYSHDASGIRFAHNLLFFNANFGLWAHLATDRTVSLPEGGKEPVSCSEWNIVNNLFVGNHRGTLGLPPPSDRSRDNHSDYNAFAGPYELWTLESHSHPMDRPEFLVSTNKGRALPEGGRMDLEAWQARTGWDTHSREVKILRPLFSTRSLFVDWIAEAGLAEIRPSAQEGLDRDYHGRPLDPDHLLPGPFQSMAFDPDLAEDGRDEDNRGPFHHVTGEHLNRYPLWPPSNAGDPALHPSTRVVEDFERDF